MGPWIAIGGPGVAGSPDRGLGFSVGDPFSRIVTFHFESDLREPVATWPRDAGFDVRIEVPILGRRADLVGSCGTSLTAIEMKMDRWAEALRQAIAYQLAADRVWVAMPLGAACRAYRHRWTFQSEEHTSELQSLAYLVCRLLLEKKKKKKKFNTWAHCKTQNVCVKSSIRLQRLPIIRLL